MNSQHRDNLPLVVKCVGYDVQQDERGTAQVTAPIHGTLHQRRIQLLFCQTGKIHLCCFSNSLFRRQQMCHRRAIFFVPSGKRLVLQIMYPPFLTRQDVHKLLPNGGMAES